MSDYEECPNTLADPDVLIELQAELGGDPAVVASFVRSYVDLLPRRVSRLQLAVDKLDLADAIDAVLSLKTSSEMVGATCMYRLATALEASIRLLPGAEHLPELKAKVSGIEDLVRGTISGLGGGGRPDAPGDGRSFEG